MKLLEFIYALLLSAERIKTIFEKDDAKKAEMHKNLTETMIPRYLGRFSKLIELNGGKWLIGTGVTWADLALAIMTDTLVLKFPDLGLEDKYPHVKNLRDSVNALPQIKKWLQTRPVTEI